jgi:hypothetical protein
LRGRLHNRHPETRLPNRGLLQKRVTRRLQHAAQFREQRGVAFAFVREPGLALCRSDRLRLIEQLPDSRKVGQPAGGGRSAALAAKKRVRRHLGAAFGAKLIGWWSHKLSFVLAGVIGRPF